MASYGVQKILNRYVDRISTPAQEVRDMLAAVADVTMNLSGGPVGTVFWVDGVNGDDDANDGLTWLKPLLTIKEALSRCTDNHNDVIMVMDYWQPTGEDWPIVVDVQQVHIVGWAQGNLPYPAIHPPSASSTVSAFMLSSGGQYGSIENLSIGGGTAGGGIEIGPEGQVDGFLIKNCTFGHSWFGTPLNGILQKVTANRGGYSNRIEKCLFLGDLNSMTKGAITGNAIDLLDVTSSATMMYGTEIVDCVFMGCAVGINMARASDSLITGNKFTVADSADGEAITLSALCYGGMISGNEAMEGQEALDNAPYKDLGTNHWGRNLSGGLNVMPVTV